jgi:hypothetical protein
MKTKNTYNAEILKKLKIKYGVSKRFITMSLKGDRVSETSEAIVKDYAVIQKAMTEAINSASKIQ